MADSASRRLLFRGNNRRRFSGGGAARAFDTARQEIPQPFAGCGDTRKPPSGVGLSSTL